MEPFRFDDGSDPGRDVELEYRHFLAYPREQVWAGLLDFVTLSRSIPGVERLDPISDDKCSIVVKVGVPLVTGTYQGTVEIIEKRPFDAYRLRGEAKGRLGWVRGEAAFHLIEQGNGTELAAKMAFQAGGMLAGVGQRLMDGVAKGMIRDFFAAFERELESSRTEGKLG